MDLTHLMPDALFGFRLHGTDIAMGMLTGLVAAALTATYTGLEPWKGAVIAFVAGAAVLFVSPWLLHWLARVNGMDGMAMSWIGSAAVAGLVAALVGTRLHASVSEAMWVTCVGGVSAWTLLNFIAETV